MICSGIMLRCECVSVYSGDENGENCLNRFFLEKELYLPFSLVQLGRVLVHSDPTFCTFTLDFVQMLRKIVQLVICFCTIAFCTIGYICCTFGLNLCTIGYGSCTFGYLLCTNGVKQ